MRIAIVAPPWFSIPPTGYGGIEAICYLLVEGLVRRGHDVTLLGVGQPGTSASFVQTLPIPQSDRIGHEVPAAVHAALVAEALDGLRPDLVHDHTLLGALHAPRRQTPTVVTVHGPVTGEMGDFYRALGTTVQLVAISDSQRLLAPDLAWAATVLNGIAVDRYRFRADKEDFLLFLGRMSPEKAPHLAIKVARAAGLPIVVAAKCSEPAERAYFEEEVQPLLGSDVTYMGQLAPQAKSDLLSKARAFLMPIQWEEPFGLVMVEALASGTPVIALNRGAVPEVIDDGVTGYVCESVDAMVEAIGRLDAIDPAACRRQAQTRFDASVTVEGYERAYRSILAGRPLQQRT